MKPKKLLPPEVPETLTEQDTLTPQILDLLSDDEIIEATHFTGVTFENLPQVRRIAFRGYAFERCTFVTPDEHPPQLDSVDCTFRGCDFAGARMYKSSLMRVAFTSCRGVGIDLSESILRSVTLQDCQFSYANFGRAKLELVEMTGCDLSHASFGEATLDTLRWVDCRLSGAELYRTKLRGIDLRTNTLDGILLGDLTELSGAIVTPIQACDLALLLGVVIEPAE